MKASSWMKQCGPIHAETCGTSIRAATASFTVDKCTHSLLVTIDLASLMLTVQSSAWGTSRNLNGQDHSAFDAVSQLAHVRRPVPFRQCFDGRDAENSVMIAWWFRSGQRCATFNKQRRPWVSRNSGRNGAGKHARFYQQLQVSSDTAFGRVANTGHRLIDTYNSAHTGVTFLCLGENP